MKAFNPFEQTLINNSKSSDCNLLLLFGCIALTTFCVVVIVKINHEKNKIDFKK